jgi:hypothetical protein
MSAPIPQAYPLWAVHRCPDAYPEPTIVISLIVAWEFSNERDEPLGLPIVEGNGLAYRTGPPDVLGIFTSREAAELCLEAAPAKGRPW